MKTLEVAGIVSRHPDPVNARKVIYTLTPKGMDLIPTLLELVRWGAKHDAETAAPRAFIRRIERDREALIAEIIAALKSTTTLEK